MSDSVPSKTQSLSEELTMASALARIGELHAEIERLCETIHRLHGQLNAASSRIHRLQTALEDISRTHLTTDCGIHPMRAAGLRAAFEITAEIARTSLSHEKDAQP